MKTYKGIIHVHSNYSHDGHNSLEEIAQYGIKCGYSFIGMSEHSDTLNEDKMAEYRKECQRVSTSNCLIIPGIEFACENDLHLIGLWVGHYTDEKDSLKVAEFIRQQNGIVIIAHPSRYNYKIPFELASAVDGIEVWNTGYDSRFVPNDCSLQLLKEIRKKKGSLMAFGGEDFHRITDRCSVKISVFCDKLAENAIIKAMRNGDFTISNSCFRLDSRREIGLLKLTTIRTVRTLYYMARGVRDYMVKAHRKMRKREFIL